MNASVTGKLAANHLLKQRYCILRNLGQGGFGAVYLATDTILGGRPRAVKEMSQSGLSQAEIREAVETFKREALMLAQLQHQSLPRIYDHFEDNGRYYLVMDFIEGETLEAYLQKQPAGRLPIEKALDIGIQLCTVLNYLHTHNPIIVFRDLKPANIMLTPGGQVYLIDFGIARHFKPGQTKDTAPLGSQGYAAPEQYGREQTSASADIYSLGATLHQLLSGDDPSYSPFKFAPLRQHVSSIPQDLEALIMQMLSVDKDLRPASASVIKQKFEEIAAQLNSQAGKAVLLPATQSANAQAVTHIAPAKVAVGTVHVSYTGQSQQGVDAVSWSFDGTQIASTVNGRLVLIWDAGTGKQRCHYDGHVGAVKALAWSPDNQLIASGGNDKVVHIWDATTGKLAFSYKGHRSRVLAISWSPKGRYVASGGDDNTVQVWDAMTGRLMVTFRGHSDSVYALAWSSDGKYIVSGGADNTAHVWEAPRGKAVSIYREHTKEVRAVGWLAGDKHVVTGSWDSTLQVWETFTARRVTTYQEHARMVNALVCLPGDVVASASKDGTVQLWHALSGKGIYTFRGHTKSVNALACSPNGLKIASGSEDATVQVWQAG